MIELSQYLSYPVLIIDDEIEDSTSIIYKLKSSLNDEGIGLLQYTNIPDSKIIQYSNLGAIILDWNLFSLPDDVSMGEVLIKKNEESILKFLNEVVSNFFIPIIIYSTLTVEDINAKLGTIINKHPNSLIRVLHKINIDGFKNAVIEWYQSTAIIHVLTEFKKQLFRAQNKMFVDFSSQNPDWPIVLFNRFREDGVPASRELFDVIIKNIISHFEYIELDKNYLQPKSEKVNSDSLKKIYERERFIGNTFLDPLSFSTGDIFKIGGNKYLLNLRPNCDCVYRDNTAKSREDMELYCISGELVKPKDKNLNIIKNDIQERSDEVIIFPIYDGKMIRFKLKKIIIKKAEPKFMQERIGRLLPPHIVRIQQKYASYLVRQGAVSYPEEIFEEYIKQKDIKENPDFGEGATRKKVRHGNKKTSPIIKNRISFFRKKN